jgi:hypothetical protein
MNKKKNFMRVYEIVLYTVQENRFPGFQRIPENNWDLVST